MKYEKVKYESKMRLKNKFKIIRVNHKPDAHTFTHSQWLYTYNIFRILDYRLKQIYTHTHTPYHIQRHTLNE